MSKEICVLAGPASKDLANSISNILSAEMIDIELKVFPDGESKIRIDGNPGGKFAVVVQSTYPPVNSKLLEALFIMNKTSKMGGEVCAVIPYLAYARQDKEFLEGEAVSMESIANMFDNSGAKSLVTVDIHSDKALSYFKIAAYNVSAIPLLAEYINTNKIAEPIVVSPDEGGKSRAEEFAKLIACDCIALPKQRDRSTGEVTIETESSGIGKAKDRNVILVDDMISTGGSLVKATEALKDAGCIDVFAVCTHALLLNDAFDKLRDAGIKQIIATNTVPSQVSKVDVASVICEQIRKL